MKLIIMPIIINSQYKAEIYIYKNKEVFLKS